MSFRSFTYWLFSSFAAALAATAAEPGAADPEEFKLSLEDQSSFLAVPEPGRAILLFAGIMAMAFTYRRAWLNWKRGA